MSTQVEQIDIGRKRPHPPEDHLTTEEAGRLIGVSEATLRDWRCDQKKGQPPYRKIGQFVWYRKSALEAWLTKQDVVR